MIAVRVWWERHAARVYSKHTNQLVRADVGQIIVGLFRDGKEVSR